MSQTSVSDVPAQAFEGMVRDIAMVKDTISRLANEAATPFIPFGKAVVKLTGDADNQCSLPAATADVTDRMLGIAVADVGIEEDSSIAWGHYKAGLAVPVLSKGRIWVIAEDQVTDISLPVFVRFTDPGGSAPLASLGSFRTDADTADAVEQPACRWRTTTAGAGELAVVEINLP